MRKAVFFRGLLLILCSIMYTPVMAQPLDSLWNGFLQLETELSHTQNRRSLYLNEQSQLIQKQAKLQQKQNWLNGWLVELRLSKVNKALVNVADTLDVIARKIDTYQEDYETYLQKFKEAYQKEFNTYNLTSLDSHRVNLLVNTIINDDVPESELPDYHHLVQSLENDAAIKQLVYNDLRLLLQEKITFIDSIIAEKQQDLILLQRLDQFHEDIVLQIEANTDIALSNQPLAETFQEGESRYASRDRALTEFGASGDGLNSENEDLSVSDQPQDDILSGTSGMNNPGEPGDIHPVVSDIQRLNTKREQYQNILQKLREEVAE